MTEAVFEDKIEGLKLFNRNMGVLHLIQSILIAILGFTIDDFREFTQSLYVFTLRPVDEAGNPITDASNQNGPPADIIPVPEELFEFTGIAPVLLTMFLFASAVAHLMIAFPLFDKYKVHIKNGMNPYRWYEYAISSSIMILFILISFGILDFWVIVATFILNALMNIFGYYMEEVIFLKGSDSKTDWKPYLWGWVAGIIPWIVIIDNTQRFEIPEGGEDFFFVFYIAVGIYFFFFNTFAINMGLQYGKIGKWKDYLYGERVYQILSLISKSILCWLIFIAILAGRAAQE